MKALLFTIFTLLSLQAFAAGERVGDWATHETIIDGARFLQTEKLSDFSTNDDLYTLTTEINQGDFVFKIEENFPTDLFATPNYYQVIINLCPRIDGVIEQLIVKGAPMKTCKLPLTKVLRDKIIGPRSEEVDGFVWVGDIPIFSIVKIESSQLQMNIIDYHWAE